MADAAAGGSGFGSPKPLFLQALFLGQQTLDPSRAVTAGPIAPRDLQHPPGADTEGAARLQAVVLLV